MRESSCALLANLLKAASRAGSGVMVSWWTRVAAALDDPVALLVEYSRCWSKPRWTSVSDNRTESHALYPDMNVSTIHHFTVPRWVEMRRSDLSRRVTEHGHFGSVKWCILIVGESTDICQVDTLCTLSWHQPSCQWLQEM